LRAVKAAHLTAFIANRSIKYFCQCHSVFIAADQTAPTVAPLYFSVSAPRLTDTCCQTTSDRSGFKRYLLPVVVSQ